MARKAEVAALEARRFEAARRFARGESQAAVARALAVTPMTATINAATMLAAQRPLEPNPIFVPIVRIRTAAHSWPAPAMHPCGRALPLR